MKTTEQTSKLMSEPEIKALPKPVQKRLRAFMNSIPKTNWYQPDGKPNPEWRVFYGDTWASARDSARASAWASARTSAWDSAWDSARTSARTSAWASARTSAWASARDFALMVDMISVSDLNYPDKEKHEKHVSSRIEVWKKGYGLLCDVDGVLYVYAKK